MPGFTHATSEQALIVGILAEAYRDLFMVVREKDCRARSDRDQALSFLTALSGPYAAHRIGLCDLIGLDGEALAQRIRRKMAGEAFPPQCPTGTPSTLRKHHSACGHVRARWSQISDP